MYRGHEVLVLASDFGVSSSDQGLQESGVRRTLALHIAYQDRTPIPLQFVWRRPLVARRDQRLLRRSAAEFQPDVVCFWNTECLPRNLAAVAEALPGVGVAYWLAGRSPAALDEYDLYWQVAGRSRSARAFKAVFRTPARAWCAHSAHARRPQMRHVGVVSAYLRRAGLAAGTLPATSEVIPNGVEVRNFFCPITTGPLAELRLILAGRLAPDKGVHVAIDALAQVRAAMPQAGVRLKIVGGGPQDYWDELRRAVGRHGLDPFVEFAGKIPRAEMPAVLRDQHVLLLPTLVEEAFPRVVLEGMAAGLAVVAADTGGTRELVVHEVTGLLCPPGDPAALAQQILRLMRQPGLRTELAANGQRRVVAEFSLERMVDRVEALLVGAASSADRRRA